MNGTPNSIITPKPFFSYTVQDYTVKSGVAQPIKTKDAINNLFLQGILKPGFKVFKPIILTIEHDIESFIVSERIFNIYGVGLSIREAIYDYSNSLIEYYELIASHAMVNEKNQVLLNQLKQYIIRASD